MAEERYGQVFYAPLKLRFRLWSSSFMSRAWGMRVGEKESGQLRKKVGFLMTISLLIPYDSLVLRKGQRECVMLFLAKGPVTMFHSIYTPQTRFLKG